jgi:hypothetical protein
MSEGEGERREESGEEDEQDVVLGEIGVDELAALVHDSHDENEFGVKLGKTVRVELGGGVFQSRRSPEGYTTTTRRRGHKYVPATRIKGNYPAGKSEEAD